MTGTIQTYIDQSELRYFSLFNDKLTYRYIRGETVIEDYDYTALKKFLTYHWKEFGTFASTVSHKIFFVCLENLLSVDTDGSDLIVEFTGDTITVAMLDEDDATFNKNYLEFVRVNYDVANRIGKSAITVNTSATEVAGSNYDTIQEAINYISSNSLTSSKYVSVDVYDGAESLTLKNGVDIYFDSGTSVTNTTNNSNLLKDNGVTVACNIYGNGFLTKNNIIGTLGSNALLKITGDDTHINLAFEKIVCPNNPVIYAEDGGPSEAMYILKGKSIKGYGVVQNNSDTLHVDCDVMKVLFDGQMIAYQSESVGYCYIRNTDCCNVGSDYSIFTDNTSGNGNNIFMINIGVNANGINCLSCEANTGHIFRSFASRFNTDYDYFFEELSPSALNPGEFIGYGNQNYTNKPAADSIAIFGDEINETSEIEMAIGNISTERVSQEADITINIDPVAFATQYEIYEGTTLLDTIDADESSYRYTMNGQSAPYLFKYRGKRDTVYSGYSRRLLANYFGRSVIQ